jgi:hypothetical protein
LPGYLTNNHFPAVSVAVLPREGAFYGAVNEFVEADAKFGSALSSLTVKVGRHA